MMNKDQKHELVLLLGETLDNGYKISYVMETVVPNEFRVTEKQITEMTKVMRNFNLEDDQEYIKFASDINKILE